jgi:hypothetical protein
LRNNVQFASPTGKLTPQLAEDPYLLTSSSKVVRLGATGLSSNSIDSWERLKRVFIDNFQGAIARAGTHHDLAQCKQERNELLRSYTHCFFDVRAPIANISEDDIIDCFYNGITDPGIYRDFGRNKPKTIAGLRDMMHDWSEQEEKMRERFPRCQDSNLRCPNDNRNDKGQRDYSGPP